MADLVTQNDTVRWIACKVFETVTNGDVVEVYWSDGVAHARRVTGAPGCAIGVVENDTNNSLSTISANAVGDVQVDGAVATVKKLASSLVASGGFLDYVINENYCVASAGQSPKTFLKATSASAVGTATVAGSSVTSIHY
jgi:hypothetical protein